MKEETKKLEEELGNPLEYEMDEKWETECLIDVNKSDEFLEYLKHTMGLDVLRYFSAQDDNSRNIIKGHYSFAKYLRAKILRTRKLGKEVA